MFIATHKKIASSAYDMFDIRVQGLVDKTAFIEGSHYPDTNFKYTVMCHDYEHTINIVKDKINEILHETHDEKTLGKKLGIICHFLADYCSPYHANNKYKKRNIVEHLKYERKTLNKVDFVLLQSHELQNKYFSSIKTLPEDLRVFIDKHMQGEKNMRSEVKYALLNSYHVINLIMSEYIKIHIDKNNYIDLIPVQEIPSVAYYPSMESAMNSVYDEVKYLEINRVP